jgi:hypothetical protein
MIDNNKYDTFVNHCNEIAAALGVLATDQSVGNMVEEERCSLVAEQTV